MQDATPDFPRFRPDYARFEAATILKPIAITVILPNNNKELLSGLEQFRSLSHNATGQSRSQPMVKFIVLNSSCNTVKKMKDGEFNELA